ncbi:MAG: hypothetical protein M3271_02890 [Actinomycetota bacterium]|nr:hypothetical protein [Actinomycetota bacterium]
MYVSFWVVLAGFVAGVIFTATASTTRTATGPAVVDESGSAVVALLPERYAPELRAGMSIEFSGGRGTTELVIADVRTDGTGSTDASSASAESQQVIGPTVEVRAEIERGRVEPGSIGQATVALGSEPLLFVLVPGLEGLFGDRDG